MKIFQPILLTFFVSAVLLIAGCNKSNNINTDNPTGNNSIEELQIKTGFDWRLSNVIDLEIINLNNSVLRITSTDGATVYHKANVTGMSSYSVSVSVPTSVEEISINGKVIQADAGSQLVNMTELKSMQALMGTTIYSLFFDGNDYVVISDGGLNGAIPSASSGAPNDFTISAWINLNSTADRKPIVAKQGTTVGGNVRGFMFSATNGGLEFEVFRTDVNKSELFSATGLFSTGTWYHVAATYKYVTDGTSEMNLYINGVNVASKSNAVGPVQVNPQPFEVGRYYYSGGYNRYFHGYMDDFRVYSVARTAGEILSDYSTVPTGTEPGLELSWIYEEGSGTTAGDETANANDGTIMGAVYSSTTVPYTFTDTDGDGVADVDDDYPTDPLRAFNIYFPAAGYGSLAYEDLWPGQGDYDFNDVVVDYRFRTVTNAANEVVEIFAVFPVKASGASLENGFGFSLPHASSDFVSDPSKLEVSGFNISEGYINLNANGHETGQSKPTFIVFDNFFNILPPVSGGIGVNTGTYAPFTPFDTVFMTFEPASGYSVADFSLTSWNPFIIVNMQRGHEVHLPDYAPTDLMNTALFGQWEDDSEPGTSRYFKTIKELPWAIDLPATFEWPVEKVEITSAYLRFAEWAESGGILYTDWYSNTAPGYRDESKIYVVP